MANETEIRAIVLEPMLALYVQPRGLTNPQLALTQYVASLKPYKAEALEGAWIAVRNGREVSTWPTIGEIVKAARDWIHANVKDETKGRGATKPDDWKRFPDNAARAMESGLGQKALAEGWGRILYDHVYQHGNYEGIRVEQMQAIDREVRRAVAELESGDHWMKDKLLKLGRTILAKEDDLRAKYLRRAA